MSMVPPFTGRMPIVINFTNVFLLYDSGARVTLLRSTKGNEGQKESQ